MIYLNEFARIKKELEDNYGVTLTEGDGKRKPNYPGCIVIGYIPELPIQLLLNKSGHIDAKNSGREFDVTSNRIGEWTSLIERGAYNDSIYEAPCVTHVDFKVGWTLTMGFCKTRGMRGAGKTTLGCWLVKFVDTEDYYAIDNLEMVQQLENLSQEDNPDFIESGRTPDCIATTLQSMYLRDSIKLTKKTKDGTVEETDEFVNKALNQMKVPKSKWLKVRNLFYDRVSKNNSQIVRNVTMSAAERTAFENQATQHFIGKNILFQKLESSESIKYGIECTRKIIDAREKGNPYDIVIFDHNISSRASLDTARIRDKKFFTESKLNFQKDLKRFKSPIDDINPDIYFHPQLDTEIIKWDQEKKLTQ